MIEKYKEEFDLAQARLIKKRIELLCYLAVGLYFFGNIISVLMLPEPFDPREIQVTIVLIVGSAIFFVLNRITKSLIAAKTIGILFAAFLYSGVAKISVIYSDYATVSSEFFLFTLFLIVFTIPWKYKGVIAVALIDMFFYAMMFGYIISQGLVPEGVTFASEPFLEGIIAQIIGAVLCVVLRRQENLRDIRKFELFKEVEEKNEQMQRELELASKIHKTLIPKSISTDRVNVAVMYLPVEFMGGDYAKFHFVGEDKLTFFICDVTGHGVSAALLVNRLHAEFEQYSEEGDEPEKLLNKLNNFVISDFGDSNMYLSAFCCQLDFKSKKMLYYNCGHPAQYLYRVHDSKTERMESLAGLLGLEFGDDPDKQQEMSFSKDDRIFLFTDGLTETHSQDNDEYGKERLEAFISKNADIRVEDFNRKLLDELTAFRGGTFEDDVFMLNIRVK